MSGQPTAHRYEDVHSFDGILGLKSSQSGAKNSYQVRYYPRMCCWVPSIIVVRNVSQLVGYGRVLWQGRVLWEIILARCHSELHVHKLQCQRVHSDVLWCPRRVQTSVINETHPTTSSDFVRSRFATIDKARDHISGVSCAQVLAAFPVVMVKSRGLRYLITYALNLFLLF